jgi:hypothetical protein
MQFNRIGRLISDAAARSDDPLEASAGHGPGSIFKSTPDGSSVST